VLLGGAVVRTSERSGVGLPSGALLGSLGQLRLPSLRGRQIKYQLNGSG